MVGTTRKNNETLAQHQAAGLRALADLITRNPALAEHVDFALRHLYTPLLAHVGDVRAVLETFRRAATATGATVAVDNLPDRCTVTAHFGPVTVAIAADAALMAGQQPSAPKYTPLAVSGGEAR